MKTLRVKSHKSVRYGYGYRSGRDTMGVAGKIVTDAAVVARAVVTACPTQAQVKYARSAVGKEHRRLWSSVFATMAR